MQISGCPICGNDGAALSSDGMGDYWEVSCDRCGNYRVTGTALDILHENHKHHDKLQRAASSHAIRRITDRTNNKVVMVHDMMIKSFLEQETIQNTIAQMDSLILWVGQSPLPPALGRYTTTGGLLSVVGAGHSQRDLDYLMEIASEMRYTKCSLDVDPGGGLRAPVTVTLTMRGWERFAALQERQPDTRRAFMAMQFGNTALDLAYQNCFRPAVAATGFGLSRLDEGQGTGLIDDQMRVAIRTSRFLLADLSSGNNGAYWEAGFAEGLGKPVLYLCQKEAWDDQRRRPHFDTNHLMTVIWSPDDFPAAQRQIAATIRNTFPADARMVEPEP